jgi:hypothetical protein
VQLLSDPKPRRLKMLKIQVQHIAQPDTETLCLCGEVAVQIRTEYDTIMEHEGDSTPFCQKCADISDAIRPEDLF